MSTTTVLVETPAGAGPRVLAFLVDAILIEFATNLPGLNLVPQYILALAYFWLLTATLGRTPGKMALGIELRSARGRLGWGTAFVREVLGKTVAFGALLLGVLWIFIDRQHRGWHDMIAGTQVVRVQKLPWSPTWDRAIGRLLAEEREIQPEQLETVPDPLRLTVLQEFARRHQGEVTFDGGALRPTGLVEWF